MKMSASGKMGLQRVNALKSHHPGGRSTMKFNSSLLINQRIESITSNHLVVGIDIAKEVHLAGAVTFRGVHIGRPLSFSNDGFGFQKLLNWVGDLQQMHGLSQVIFGAESTGHYFLNLAFWLQQQGQKLVLVNPMTTKRNKENRDNKPSKNDTKDAIVIADAVSRGYYSDWVVRDDIFLRLRCLVNEREALAQDLTALGNQLQMVLDQSFPEFTSVFNEWNGPRALATLHAFPLPSDLKDLTIEKVIEGWREAGMLRAGGVRGRQQAATLLTAARRSVGITTTAPEIKRQIGRLIHRYDSLKLLILTVEQELFELLNQVPQADRQPLEEIGLSPLFVAVILANTGNLNGYAHGNQLLALAGLSLSESASGKRKGKIVLSKRGRRQLRKYLYLAVLGLVANQESFRRWHAHNVTILKMKKQKSIFKLIGKLARIVVALANNGESFVACKAESRLLQAA